MIDIKILLTVLVSLLIPFLIYLVRLHNRLARIELLMSLIMTNCEFKIKSGDKSENMKDFARFYELQKFGKKKQKFFDKFIST